MCSCPAKLEKAARRLGFLFVRGLSLADWSLQSLKFPDEANKLVKSLIHVHPILCTAFNEWSFQLFCHILTFLPGYLEK